MQSNKIFQIVSEAGLKFPMVGMGDKVFCASDICLNDFDVEFGSMVNSLHYHTEPSFGIVKQITCIEGSNDERYSVEVLLTNKEFRPLKEDDKPKLATFEFHIDDELTKNRWTKNQRGVEALIDRSTKTNNLGLERLYKKTAEMMDFISKATQITEGGMDSGKQQFSK